MTRKPLIGLMVIGRSPREDLETEFRRVLGNRCEIRMVGALDGVPDEEVGANRPLSDADTLFSIMPDGRSTLLSKAFVTGKLSSRISELRADGGHVNVMCCTGYFPELAEQQIITASSVMLNFARAAGAPDKTLGVFIPKRQQVAHATERWRKNGFEPAVVPLAPDASDSQIDGAARQMSQHAPVLVVYDCISYRHSTRKRVADACDAPTIVASSATAHVVAEMVGA
ncbi:MAG: AroM family protein [Alphaproteobacteria bacterium]|nr:AroM family protein [Alphaproteobacteria bacterium]